MPDGSAEAAGLILPRSADQEASDSGQWGLAFRYYSEAFNGTEFGLYHMNYHSRTPIFSANNATVAFGFPVNFGANPDYFFEFPEDIELWGLTFATNLGAWAVSGELSYRPDFPLQINTTDLLQAVALGTAAEWSRMLPRTLAAGPGGFVAGYDNVSYTQAQMTFIKFFEQVFGAQRLSFAAEVGAVFLGGMEEGINYGRSPSYGVGDFEPFSSQFPLWPGSPVACNSHPAAEAFAGIRPNSNGDYCTSDGFTDDFSWGYRVRASLEYTDVFAGVNLTPNMAWSHDVKGTSPVPVSVTLTAVHFPQPELGWAVGHAGTILHSSDGGESWSLQFDGNDANRKYLAWAHQRVQHLEQALAAAEDEVLLAELDYLLEEASFAAEDAADAIHTGPADPFLDVLFVDADSGFAVGAYGMLYRTDNAGADWEIAIAGIDNVDRYHYYALAAAGDGRLYLSGEAGLLYYSSDSGNSWERVEDLYDGSLFGVVLRAGELYAYGLRGHVFRSIDVGVSWEEVPNPERYSLYGGTLLADGHVLMVGAGGLVLSSTDSGALRGWRHPSRSSLSSAVQTASGDILLVGMSGLLTLSEAEPLD